MSRPTSVALIVPSFPRLSETFIVTKAVGLLERGLDVHVVCGESREDQWEVFGSGHPLQALRPRVHVSPSLTSPLDAARQSTRALRRLAGAPRAARKTYLADRSASLRHRMKDLVVDADLVALAPDVVHFEFGSLAPGRMHLGARLGCAVTVSFRGYDLNYVGLDRPGQYEEVWAHADRVHLLGEDLWRRARRRGAPATLAHSLIAPALDTSAITPRAPRPGALGSHDRPLRVISVGRLHWKKGYDYALEAIGTLRARDIAVEHRIIGDGELLEAVAFWRHQLDLDQVTNLLGAVAPHEVADHYRWADVMLHAATSEGFCNAVIEAQAHGLPVVCSDADGLAENVEDGTTGLVVPRRDPDALAAALERLARESTTRAMMAASGPERVQRCFAVDRQLDAWEHFYAEAIATRWTPG